MHYTRILAVALMLTLGAGAAFAQDADRPKREGDRKEHDQGDHAARHAKFRQHLKELQARLERLKAKQADGSSEDPERLAEAIKRIEAKIAEMKEKGAKHMEKHKERDGKKS